MNVYEIDPKEITVPEERTRKVFDKEKLQRLATSFGRIGQQQPGVCSGDAGNYKLVCGERRLRACILAGIPFSFVLEKETDEDYLFEIEVEENICRVNLTWQEDSDAVAALHELRDKQRRKEGGTQRFKDTAEEADVAVGTAYEDIELSKFMGSFQEVRDAKTKTEAKKIIKRYKSELFRKQLLEDATETASESTARTEDAPEKQESGMVEVAGKLVAGEALLDFDRRIIYGKMENELDRFKDETVNIMFFDPPWGVGLDEVRKKGGGTGDFEDNREKILEIFPIWLRQLWEKMARDSHLYLFFGIVHHQFVFDQLEQVGFRTNRIPLIWYKQGAHVTRNPEIWPGRSYEPVAFARKGDKPIVKPGAPDVIITPAPTPTLKQDHPAAKHPDIYIELLSRSASPGDVVLDPMAGSCMSAVAAETHKALKLDWWMIEQDKSFRDLGMTNVARGYFDLVAKPRQGDLEPRPPGRSERGRYDDQISAEYEIPEVAADYKTLEPGGTEWKRYWKMNADQQDEMLKWRAGK